MGRGGGGVGRYSWQGRAGQSGVQATVWVSDTSAVCKMSGGLDGSMVVAMSAGGRAGSLTASLSFDGRMSSSVAGANEGSTGGGSVSVSGADFGTSRCFMCAGGSEQVRMVWRGAMCLGVWLALLEGASQRHRLIWGRKCKVLRVCI